MDKILPNRPLGYEPLFLLEVFDHPGEVASIGQLQDDVELVVLDERGQVLDNIGMIELLAKINKILSIIFDNTSLFMHSRVYVCISMN